MKRSELQRRTPLRSSSQLGRGKRLRAKKLDLVERSRRAAIREQVFLRDGYRCQLEGVEGASRCFGQLTPHHRRKAGQGGGYTVENLVALCAHHNDQLEADADLAALGKRLGLVITRETMTEENPDEGARTDDRLRTDSESAPRERAAHEAPGAAPAGEADPF